ncbi:MAG: toprim domain-containing protein, partial [Patescibacteria group bacterium]|nr:toprim domain-containing protein [Patescibacteria group bacterium]
ALRRSRTALVMEGYTDCIVAHQQGFQDAVAVLGTALGENHVRILKRFADRIILVLDGDEAGQRRANEVLELFVAEQVDLRILTLPEGADPCDFLLERGAAAFANLLENSAIDALDHAFHAHTRGIDLAHDVHAGSEALERLVAIVAKAPRLKDDTTTEARFREQKVLQRLAAAFRIPEEDVRRRMTELRRARGRGPATPTSTTARGSQSAPPIAPWERELIELLIAHPALIGLAAGSIKPEHMAQGPCRRIFETSCRLMGDGFTPDFDRLMLEFDQEEIKNLLVKLDEQARAKGTCEGNPEALLKEIIRTRKRHEVQQRSPAALASLRNGRLDEQQQEAILQALVEQARSQQNHTKPTDG